MEATLSAVMSYKLKEIEPIMQEAYRDMILYGTGIFKIKE